MPEEYSDDELVAAYLLHRVFNGEELQEKMKKCRIREEVARLTTEELKYLLEKKYPCS